MTFDIFRLTRKSVFRYPMDPAPRTAVLAACFRQPRFRPNDPVRVFPQGWSEEVAAFAPAAIAAPREQLLGWRRPTGRRHSPTRSSRSRTRGDPLLSTAGARTAVAGVSRPGVRADHRAATASCWRPSARPTTGCTSKLRVWRWDGIPAGNVALRLRPQNPAPDLGRARGARPQRGRLRQIADIMPTVHLVRTWRNWQTHWI